MPLEEIVVSLSSKRLQFPTIADGGSILTVGGAIDASVASLIHEERKKIMDDANNADTLVFIIRRMSRKIRIKKYSHNRCLLLFNSILIAPHVALKIIYDYLRRGR